jgi:tetratricopeptide (TPR) repeat protein
MAIDPANARTWIVRGFALHNLGRYEDAVASYARAIELNPFGADGRMAWNNRGAALDNMRRQNILGNNDYVIILFSFTN